MKHSYTNSINFRTFVCISLVITLMSVNKLYSQESRFKRGSVKTGIGIGLNEGSSEVGFGLVYTLGWQRSFGEKEKFRIHPNITCGNFLPIAITDIRDQYYRITSLGINAHFDLIKIKAVSLVITGGGFVDYSRGLLGTGGWPEANNNSSEYFTSIYFGVNASAALRVNPLKSRLAFELRPINLHYGNDDFILSYMMICMDFKFRK